MTRPKKTSPPSPPAALQAVGTGRILSRTAQRPAVLSLLALLLLGLALCAAYANTLNVPFLFDDRQNITQNPSIRPPFELGKMLHPPAAATVTGRPLMNLTLALNFALGELEPAGYHVVNLLIHILAAWALYLLMLELLRAPPLREHFSGPLLPHGLALTIALLWSLHPVQTMAVTYLSQRCEAMAALFLFLTLFFGLRGMRIADRHGESTHRPAAALPWHAAALCAFGLGALSKETIATALPLLLAIEWVLLGPKSLRRSIPLHAGLALGTLLLVVLVLGSGRVDASVQLADPKLLPYVLTQGKALLHYLRLAVWPHPLIFDYFRLPHPDMAESLPWALAHVPLIALTLWGFARRKPWSLTGMWFYGTLAPTSLVPMVDIILEYRMYPALAGLMALAVLGGWHLLRRFRNNHLTPVALGLACLLAFVLGAATLARNADYRSDRALWEETLRLRPNNARATMQLGYLAAHGGNPEWAEFLYRKALFLVPRYVEASYNLGNLLQRTGRVKEAIPIYKDLLRLAPNMSGAWGNLGVAHMRLQQYREALEPLTTAVHQDPASPPFHGNLALCLSALGRHREAEAEALAAQRLAPTDAQWQEILDLVRHQASHPAP